VDHIPRAIKGIVGEILTEKNENVNKYSPPPRCRANVRQSRPDVRQSRPDPGFDIQVKTFQWFPLGTSLPARDEGHSQLVEILA
jgi:hypothetical protein